jgi:hypothetical protein
LGEQDGERRTVLVTYPPIFIHDAVARHGDLQRLAATANSSVFTRNTVRRSE